MDNITGPGFYKLVDNELSYAPNFVDAPTYTLNAVDKDTYTFPIDGWVWANDSHDAESAMARYNRSISPLQARLALIQVGLMPQVQTMIDGADILTKTAWEFATEFKRSSPLLLSLAVGLGLSTTQLDELFDAAALIMV